MRLRAVPALDPAAAAAHGPLAAAPRLRGTAGLPLLHRMRWPLPALVTWTLAWAIYLGAASFGLPLVAALIPALVLGAAATRGCGSRWRAIMLGAGFPVSLLLYATLYGAAAPADAVLTAARPLLSAAPLAAPHVQGGLLGSLPAWVWLIPLAGLGLAYPLRAWRDAPFFPTPSDALSGLAEVALLPDDARILDAGCGLGHGLQALRQVYPQARFAGVEWSWPLRWAAALRCPWARIRRGDMWSGNWRDYDLVYLFQRPESMERAVAKALQDMKPGSWLVSLEFKAPHLPLHALLQREDARPVWVYQIPGESRRLPPR